MNGITATCVEKGKTMTDYIKREDAIRSIADHDEFKGERWIKEAWADYMIEDAPTIDVAPVRHGHWIFNQDEMSLHCSYCDEVFRFEDAEKDECLDFMEYAKYCLACGTRMDGESDECNICTTR